jgi:hypothetical protein
MGTMRRTRAGIRRDSGQGRLEALEPRELLSVSPGEPEPAADISEGAWVKRLYLDVMGRPAADAEANYWTGRLEAGVTKSAIAVSLINSRERRAAAVDDYYQKVLGRTVDPSGLEFWLSVWDATGGPEVVRASLIGSGEYFHKAGGTKQGAIQALYNDLLRRTAVDSEENYWIDVMSRAALANVAYGFVTSDEFRLQAVDQWYHDYLHRDVDPGGGAFWVGLMRGGMSQAQAQASLLAGVEYARQPYFDVRDFGATANNGTDDTAAIQAAFNAADAAGSSLIYIPAGIFVVDNLRLAGDHLKISGPGTLKLKNASANVGTLTIDGSHNLISYISIDGNQNGMHTGRAEGLRLVGDDNRVFRVQVSNTYMAEDGISEASGQNFVVFGTGNRLTETRSINAGHSGYRQVGDKTMYRDIVSLNSRVKGFNASGNGTSFTVDGGRFETNAAHHPLGVNSFQIDPGPGNLLQKVVLRNLVVKGPQNSTQVTTNAAKIVLVNEILIENSSFISTTDMHSSLRFAEGMGKVTMRNVFLSRNLFMQQDTSDGSGIDDPMEELYMDRVAIGDGVHHPTYSMEDIEVGKLTMIQCRLIGFWGAGISWESPNNGYMQIDVRDSVFQGYHSTRTTYDIMANGVGVLNPVKMTWNNVQRSNTAGGGAAFKP